MTGMKKRPDFAVQDNETRYVVKVITYIHVLMYASRLVKFFSKQVKYYNVTSSCCSAILLLL